MQYTQDFDETLPLTNFGQNGANYGTYRSDGNYYKWMDAIYPYVKSEQLFNCPSDGNSDRQYKNHPAGQVAYTGYLYGSYVANSMYKTDGSVPYSSPVAYGGDGGDKPRRPRKLSEVINTAETIFCLDGGRWDGSKWTGGIDAYQMPYITAWDSGWTPVYVDTAGYKSVQCTDTYMPARHLETINILWCDGHVKSMKLDALMTKVGTSSSNSAYPNLRKYFSVEDD